MIRVQHNVKLSRRGRKDIPPDKGWITKYRDFPINRMKINYSFNTGIDYEYGKTITVKNHCRNEAKKLGKRMNFAVREWKGKIRVWRTK